MNNYKKHIEQDKHLNDPNKDGTIHVHIGKNEKLSNLKKIHIFQFLGIFGVLKIQLTSLTQTSLN